MILNCPFINDSLKNRSHLLLLEYRVPSLILRFQVEGLMMSFGGFPWLTYRFFALLVGDKTDDF